MNDWTELSLRIAAAVAAGGAVGLNRDLFGRPTGVRVHALVALGAAISVMVAQEIAGPGDVTRVIQGVLGGIGFLGAGVIMRGDPRPNGTPASEGETGAERGSSIRHLTTAASIWLTAALGVAAGLGHWKLGFLACVAALIVLIAGMWIDQALFAKFGYEEDRGRNGSGRPPAGGR